MVRRSVTSWRQLPFNLYQIRTKFRDEIRPRFGLLRGREFLNEGRVLLDLDAKGLDVHYRKMDGAYRRIFDRCGLEFAVVQADSGAIGARRRRSSWSSPTRGDALVFSDAGDYGANIEKAETGPLPEPVGGGGAGAVREGRARCRPLHVRGPGAAPGTEQARRREDDALRGRTAGNQAFRGGGHDPGRPPESRDQGPKAVGALTPDSFRKSGSPGSHGRAPARRAHRPHERGRHRGSGLRRPVRRTPSRFCGANQDDHLHAGGLDRARRQDRGVRRGRDGARGDPSPPPGDPPDQAGHRGRPHLQAGDEVLRLDEVRGGRTRARRWSRSRWVLRPRRPPDGRGGHRAAPRRTTASSGRRLARSACVVGVAQRDAEVVAAADRLYEELKAPASRSFTTTATSGPG